MHVTHWTLIYGYTVTLSALIALHPGISATGCNNSTCVNGICEESNIDTTLGYNCICHTNWYGENCTEFVCDRIEEYPCRNNGTCHHSSANHSNYYCSCDDQYSGERCEISHFNCTNVSCSGNGNCSDNALLPSGYQCKCDVGFNGTECETDIDDCLVVNCGNGTCIDKINNYSCSCYENYTGLHCEHLDYCAIHSAEETHGCPNGICCGNGGNCFNDFIQKRHNCSCPPPWLSDFGCRRMVQACAINPCINNGVCNNRGVGYVCTCTAGFTGQNCETDIELCTADTCSNNAICTNGVSGPICHCAEGYTGSRCETVFNPCDDSPCFNGSICVPEGNSFTCDCPSGQVYLDHFIKCFLKQDVRVTVQPKRSVIPIGANITIACKASHILGTQVYLWERKHIWTWSIIINSINITSYTTSSFGQYRCRVSNETVTAVSKPVIVKVTGSFLKITEQPKSGQIKRGASYTLTCNASGSGTMMYSWETRLSRDQKWTTVKSNAISYSTSTQGQYRCRVANEAGSVTSKKAVITVFAPPGISIRPINQLITVGMEVVLHCNGSSQKPLSYAWETRSNYWKSWTRLRNSRQKLVLADIQNSHQYRCIVSNIGGQAISSTATVAVLAIIRHPRSQNVSVGSKVLMSCTSSISSDVTFSWTKNGRSISSIQRRQSLISTGRYSKLLIKRAKRRDTGDYKCIAQCGSLSVMSNTASLLVNHDQLIL